MKLITPRTYKWSKSKTRGEFDAKLRRELRITFPRVTRREMTRYARAGFVNMITYRNALEWHDIAINRCSLVRPKDTGCSSINELIRQFNG